MNKKHIKTFLLLFVCFFSQISMVPIAVQSKQEFFFTLKAIYNPSGDNFDYMILLKQQCARIGIEIDLKELDWPTFLAEFLFYHDFDIGLVNMGPIWTDPDMMLQFGEGSMASFHGYEQTLDWNESLQMGMNQWYLEQGRYIMPPDSEERVYHYWKWQQYLMDKILPAMPTFTSNNYRSYWSNLVGYDKDKSLLENWGKISWDGLHEGQVSDNEFIISASQWLDLNPLTTVETASMSIIGKILDSLFTFDEGEVYPHMATDFEMINDSHVRIHLREGIKWQTDPEGLFTEEYFDADDVYFTFYAWKNLSPKGHMFNWMKDYQKVDQYTFDIYIDGDPNTLEIEPYAPFLHYLGIEMLPEHYLNQTQLLDGITPDNNHHSWQFFSSHCFGTGLFEFDSYIDGVETTLELFDDCWWLDASIDKTDMDFEERYGNFTNCMRKLKFRQIPYHSTSFMEFLSGNLDSSALQYQDMEYLEGKSEYVILARQSAFIGICGFNLREDREIIANRTSCDGDSSISKGLAIRKALAYATNRFEMNEVLHGGRMIIWDHPLFPGMGKWYNPNIIRYNYDLEKAKEYIQLAGYGFNDTNTNAAGFENLTVIFYSSSLFIISIIIFTKRRKKQ